MNTPHSNTAQIAGKLLAYLKTELNNTRISYAADLKPLQGGYETSIYRFQLKGVKDAYAQPLVLRLYPRFYGTQNATWESTVQNVVANAGYPAAKAHFVCTDLSILDGAFFIMDHIPGALLMFENPDTVPEILGRLHAALHKIDPEPLIETLQDLGIKKDGYHLAARFESLKYRTSRIPWLQDGLQWLIANLPPASGVEAVCHGDFHPLNIVVKAGEVTGVLDWGGFGVGDPVYDVANTVVLTTIPARHLSAEMEGFPAVDWEIAAQIYLLAYQAHREIDLAHLEYYRVRRCLQALVEGAEGQKVWQHPLIVADLVRYIQGMTGIQIELPADPYAHFDA